MSVAVPAPLYKLLDYRLEHAGAAPGVRVRVPLGRREVVGVVVGEGQPPPEGEGVLRAVLEQIDPDPLVPPELLALLRWAAGYYQHPLGEVMAAALPGPLRAGKPADWQPPQTWVLTSAGEAQRAQLPAHHRAQRAVLEALATGETPPRGPPLQKAVAEGWARQVPVTEVPATPLEAPLPLTEAQAAALAGVADGGVQLLQGVTGSGKTEVYLRAAAEVLARGGQVLVLVPEIGLTPQTLARFRARFGGQVASYHSGLADGRRSEVWQATRAGAARVVIGTRSAVWLPFARLGLIVVDEEHDPSFKQQEGFRYSARDVASYRGARLGIPVLLGSATPALETLHNAVRGRYRHLRLPARIHDAAPPRVECLDLRGMPLHEGLSPPLLQALDDCLAREGQALLFLNRRGFAPIVLCHTCGWSAPCPACDAHLTLHRGPSRLVCHHCGHQSSLPTACPSCDSQQLIPVGQGTERIEAALAARFPGERIERFDADRSRSPRALDSLLADIHSGQVRLLVGTQMLAKGHDFPRLDLVGIVSADQALFGSDFRAIERMGQLVTQVAGRAGRAGQPARVLLQTHLPEHPLLQTLLLQGYDGLSDALLREREEMELPPYSHLALLRAEAAELEAAMAFLAAAARRCPTVAGVQRLPPMASGMERRAGRRRAQMLLMAAHRPALQAVLAHWIPGLSSLRESRRVRWSIDVDPYDLF